jgi:predicted Zn-dependent protease
MVRYEIRVRPPRGFAPPATPAALAAFALALALGLAAPSRSVAARPDPDPDPVFDAMRAELGRARAGLRLDGYPAPYFVSFQLWQLEEAEVGATLGAAYTDDQRRRAVAAVDVRVGDYDLDNSENSDDALGFELFQRYQPSAVAPLGDDPRAVAHTLWLLADYRYKEALLSYSRIRGQRAFEREPDDRPPSFSREEPGEALVDAAPPAAERQAALAGWRREWGEVAQRLSRRFLDRPEIFDSQVVVKAREVTRRFVTTEGTALRTHDRFVSFTVTAVTRAADGMLLDHSYVLYWRTPEQAPQEAELAAGVDGLVADLLALRAAPVLDPYTGPAILAPQATGVFFHEALGHRLEGQRQHGDEEGQTFRGQVGRAVLPRFLSVVDDPTLPAFEGHPLNGWYRFDEEGVAAQRTVLVEDGVLRRFLLGRRPVEGFAQSNGHGRATFGQRPVARMANLMVLGAGGLGDGELKQRLIAEARRLGKPFGLRIESIQGGSTDTTSYGYQVFKGTPRMVYKVDAETGEETLVRGVEFVGTPLTALNRIVAVGSRYDVFNGYCGAESGFVPVATVAPATLFEEVELQRSHQPKERPQVLPPPWGAEAHRGAPQGGRLVACCRPNPSRHATGAAGSRLGSGRPPAMLDGTGRER